MSLADWKDLMNQACRDAGHRPGCLNLQINYTDKKSSDDECEVTNVSPPIGKKVTTSTRVRLKVNCETSEPDTSSPDNNTTDQEQGQPDNNTTDQEQGQPDNNTTDKKEDETGG